MTSLATSNSRLCRWLGHVTAWRMIRVGNVWACKRCGAHARGLEDGRP